MIKYIQRFSNGNIQYLAMFNKRHVYTIFENTSYIGGFSVMAYGSIKSKHFNSIEAAKNFIETISAIKL